MIKIVIVEDLPIILEGLKVLLGNNKNIEIVGEYKNGKEFVDDLNNIEPDIVITDIDMPIMDGVTATKIAVAKKPNLKVIALSMHSDSKFYYEMVTAGAKGFVLKQAQVNELEKAIQEVSKGGHYFSEELLRKVILGMQGIESEIVNERKELLKLSDRETQMLDLLCQGHSNKELANELFVSLRTIESAKTKLMQKTNSKNTAGLIIWAIKNKVVQI